MADFPCILVQNWVQNGSQMVFFGHYMMGPVLMNTVSMREYAVGVILVSMNSIVWASSNLKQ